MTVLKKKKLIITSKEEGSSMRVNKNARVIDPVDDDSEEALWLKESAAIEEKLEAVNFDNMDKEGILMEIQKVDKELLRINFRLAGLSRKHRHIYKGDSDALTLQLRTLKQRSDMLFKCLDKVLPDKKQTTMDLTLKNTEVDQIPNSVLAKIVAGTITEEEFEHYQHIFEKERAAEKETKH